MDARRLWHVRGVHIQNLLIHLAQAEVFCIHALISCDDLFVLPWLLQYIFNKRIVSVKFRILKKI